MFKEVSIRYSESPTTQSLGKLPLCRVQDGYIVELVHMIEASTPLNRGIQKRVDDFNPAHVSPARLKYIKRLVSTADIPPISLKIVTSDLDKILKFNPDYRVLFIVKKDRTWPEVLRDLNKHELSIIQSWLAGFSKKIDEELSWEYDREIRSIFTTFKRHSEQLHRQGIIRVSPRVRFKRTVAIMASAHIEFILTNTFASYSHEYRVIELGSATLNSLDSPSFKFNITHELCHACFQSFGKNSFCLKYPLINEGTTDILARMYSLEQKEFGYSSAYSNYVKIIELLCERSPSIEISIEHFIWARTSTKWLDSLENKLNKVYSKKLNVRSVMGHIERELKKDTNLATKYNGESGLLLLKRLSKLLSL